MQYSAIPSVAFSGSFCVVRHGENIPYTVECDGFYKEQTAKRIASGLQRQYERDQLRLEQLATAPQDRKIVAGFYQDD